MQSLNPSRPVSRWRIVAGPLSVSSLCFVGWVLCLAIPGAWLTVALAVAWYPRTVATVMLLAAVLTVAGFWRRRHASGLAMIAGFAALYLLCRPTQPLGAPATYASDLVRVVYYRPALRRRADELRRQGITPALGVLSVDGFGSLTSGVAYDPSRELSLPPSRRSARWIAAARGTELGVAGLEARRVVGDYYTWFHD